LAETPAWAPSSRGKSPTRPMNLRPYPVLPSNALPNALRRARQLNFFGVHRYQTACEAPPPPREFLGAPQPDRIASDQANGVLRSRPDSSGGSPAICPKRLFHRLDTVLRIDSTTPSSSHSIRWRVAPRCGSPDDFCRGCRPTAREKTRPANPAAGLNALANLTRLTPQFHFRRIVMDSHCEWAALSLHAAPISTRWLCPGVKQNSTKCSRGWFTPSDSHPMGLSPSNARRRGSSPRSAPGLPSLGHRAVKRYVSFVLCSNRRCLVPARASSIIAFPENQAR